MINRVNKVLIVDGLNLLWRAALGFPTRVRSKTGADITGIFGFFALLNVAWREYGSTADVIVCFDGQQGLQSRQSISSGYKASRADLDLTPLESLDAIKLGLDHSSIRWIELPREEADDVIATIVNQLVNAEIAIMSTDTDYYQLVSERVVVLNTCRKPGSRFVTADDIRDRFGITPKQWCDFKALTGDASDEIEGVPGIGPKTAARLLNTFGPLDSVRQTSDKAAGRVKDHWTAVAAARELIELKTDVAMPSFHSIDTPPIPKARVVIEQLGFW